MMRTKVATIGLIASYVRHETLLRADITRAITAAIARAARPAGLPGLHKRLARYARGRETSRPASA